MLIQPDGIDEAEDVIPLLAAQATPAKSATPPQLNRNRKSWLIICLTAIKTAIRKPACSVQIIFAG